MSTALLLALHLVAQQTQIDVSTRHEIVEMAGKPYLLLAKGTQLEAKIQRESTDGQVWIDVARVGLASDNRAGLGLLNVTMGAQTQTVRVRAPLASELAVGTDRIGSEVKSTSLVLLEKRTKLSLEASAEDSDLLVSIAIGGMTQEDAVVYRMPAMAGAEPQNMAVPADVASEKMPVAPEGDEAQAPAIQSVKAMRLGMEGAPLRIVVEGQDASGKVVALIARFLDANGEVVEEARTDDQVSAMAPAADDDASSSTTPEADAAAAGSPETEASSPTTPEAAPNPEATAQAAEAAPADVAAPNSAGAASQRGPLPSSDRFFFDFPVYGQTQFVAERTFPQFFSAWGDRIAQVEVQVEDESGQRSQSVRATIEVVSADGKPDAAVAAARPSFLQHTLGLPLSLSAQVSAGGALQVVGALQPLVLQGGLRLGARWTEGEWQRYGIALAIDALQQAASTPATYRPSIRWSSGETRLRLEGSADVGRYDIAGFDVGASVLAGFGVTMGNHYVVAAGKTTQLPLLGPTARVALMADTRLGPGALTLALPLDVAVDMAGGVSGYGPIALGLTAGYRFDF